jgi:tRNA pseudouridine55 synthase
MTPAPEPGGLLVVDKPAGWTSHDVVARVRKIAGTRRVGHAGTLDPMATGVLVLGVERATKLLGHLTLTDKSYAATIRLGQDTVTDDAEGEPTGGASAAAVTEPDLAAGLAALTGVIQQVPSAVSAIKVGGRRSYARVRAGEGVELASRPVTVSRLALAGWSRPSADLLDLDVEVDCSAGTYVRALARDLGRALGTGGHLTALRRTRVGPFTLADAFTLEALAERADPVPIPLDAAVAAAFPRRELTGVETDRLRHGGRLDPLGRPGPYGAFDPDGHAVALVEDRAGAARPLVVFRPA